MNILRQFPLLFPLLLFTSLTAQVPASKPENPADSSAAAALRQVHADTTQPDSLLPPVFVAPMDAMGFEMPGTAYEIESSHVPEFLFQDLAQLFSNTLPGIPLAAGEVGQPHYWASGELPARVITTWVDSVNWIPGVYGTVDLSGLPEAGANNTQFDGLHSPVFAPGAVYTGLRLTRDSLSYDEPLTRVGYAKGPFGADATRISFSRAFSRRLAGDLNVAFSNADGQFVDLPYKGHKARLHFDYRLGRRWRLIYRHFNVRNEVGIGVPFFPEEWPQVDGAFHKEERLYHAVDVAPSRKFLARAFYWQVKEELNDPARQIRHRVRDGGAEAHGQWQHERAAVAVHARIGNEQIHSTSIIPGSRWYGNIGATFSWRLISRFWLQSEGQYQRKGAWPESQALSLAGLWRAHASVLVWVRARQQRVPPALSEKDNQLLYLSSNLKLQAVDLVHLEGGFSWRRNAFAGQVQVGSARWREGYLFAADSAAGPAYLRNDDQSEQTMAARAQLQWQPKRDISIQLVGAQNLQSLPRHYWFWYQPEGFARLQLEARRTFFKNELEVMPRFSVRYLGERTSPVFSEESVLPQFKTFAAVTTFDFHLRLRYGSGAILFAWENLLNNKYALRDGVPDPGLLFRWGFHWTFRD